MTVTTDEDRTHSQPQAHVRYRSACRRTIMHKERERVRIARTQWKLGHAIQVRQAGGGVIKPGVPRVRERGRGGAGRERLSCSGEPANAHLPNLIKMRESDVRC